ncbi:MAG: glycoside hydrolase family 3 C-terminal domain-containing protein [Bacteroidales bacterium]|nr:MAG: glycoside hydrolase family 3 C-terminal domain-containing protein [Bacteroidales bacterium]
MKMLQVKKMLFIKALITPFILSFVISCSQGEKEIDNIDEKVGKLLSEMTLEEKVGQMVNIGLPAILEGDVYYAPRDTAIIDTAKLAMYIGKYGVGSVHNTPGYPPDKDEWHRLIKQIQDYAINNTRHSIPVIYGIDGVHGANFVNHSTMLPQQIGLAASWNTELAGRAGEITAYELRAASIPWNYAPVIDVASQPLWGRMYESFGEDPYLISQLSNAYIMGAQGNSISDTTKVTVCLKHYIGYGAAVNGKDRANALIPENNLRQYYLPPFTAAIKYGALTIMLSSNSVNGIPCHINKYYLTDILKEELGFQGFTVSDFSDIDFLVDAHQVAHDKKEATKQAILAGLDMIMNPYNADVSDILVELVNTGEIPVGRIDDAVRRILQVKFKIGLFENPYSNPDFYKDFGSEKLAEDNYKAASECITLLKNENLLPLPGGSKILVTGVASNSMNYINGGWSRTFQGQDTSFNNPEKQTILDAVINKAGRGNVKFIQGTGYEDDINTKKAVRAAGGADYIIACLGEFPAAEKPSDIDELTMPQAQQNLVKELAKAGKPVILVLVEGRPRIIRDIEPLVQGILLAYLPGDEGGRAVADIIFGDVNPSGKLPFTYPKYTGNALTYWHKKADIRDKSWRFNGFYPQYEFGYGLSYTTFEYSNLELSADTLAAGDSLHITIDVSNTGNQAGKEIVELYIKDQVCSVSPDVKKLVRFRKINLEPGEIKTIEFILSETDLAFVGKDNKWITEKGYFTIFIGGDPGKLMEENFLFLK